MAEVVPDDILEKIFLRLEVKDIIQCKSVCKSWFSVISSSGFINSHLKHNYNNTTQRTRISIGDDGYNNLVGSSNGLVCIFNSGPKLCVLNPCTRERKIVRHPYLSSHHRDPKPDLYGFGYDSSSGDYKVIIGKVRKKFGLLSLKSNDQRIVDYGGKLECAFDRGCAGILCNGALHWLMRDQNYNTVILSFHLSTEEFEEIPTPTDNACKVTYRTELGIIEECLCLFHESKCYPVWVLKNYNDKQSWEETDEKIIQDVKVLEIKSYRRATTFLRYNIHLSENPEYISAPEFVQSLVSPHCHFNKIQKRKWRTTFMHGGY
uniref:F-box protein CPR1-like n=1 Tax=Erigeron canadensis TaxID=72917 RepID=UPI001CB90B7E|nr:F-box protein CPR1-like [Erigeron canadensis]